MSYLKISMKDNFSAPLMKKLQQAGPRAAQKVASEILRSTNDYVPASGAPAGLYNRAQAIDGTVIYPGPYAQYLYYGRVMVFEDPPYLRTVNGKEVLSHYGQKKKPIDKPLKIKKHHHPKAQSHWFEASKAQNLDKWVKTAEEAIEYELDK